MRNLILLLVLTITFMSCSMEQTLVSQTEVTTETKEAVSDSDRASYPWEFGLMGIYDQAAGSNIQGFCATTTSAWVRDDAGNMRYYDKRSHVWSPDTYLDSHVITMDSAINISANIHYNYELRDYSGTRKIYRADMKASDKTPKYLFNVPSNTKEIAAASVSGKHYVYVLTTDSKLYQYASTNGYVQTLISSSMTYVSSIACTTSYGVVRLYEYTGYYARSFSYATLGNTSSSSLSIPKDSSGNINWNIIGRYSYQIFGNNYSAYAYYLTGGITNIDCITYNGELLTTGVASDGTFDFSVAVNRIYALTQPN